MQKNQLESVAFTYHIQPGKGIDQGRTNVFGFDFYRFSADPIRYSDWPQNYFPLPKLIQPIFALLQM